MFVLAAEFGACDVLQQTCRVDGNGTWGEPTFLTYFRFLRFAAAIAKSCVIFNFMPRSIRL